MPRKDILTSSTEQPEAVSPSVACGGVIPPPFCEPLLDSVEAGAILKLNPKVVERKAKHGEIPALKVGKFWRYRASALDSWIQSRLKSNCQVCRVEPEF
jgi:hypothetical protein